MMSKEDALFYGMILIGMAIWTFDSVVGLDALKPANPEPVVVERVISFQEVKPLFEKNCVRCHSAAHWNWTDYPVAYRKREQIKFRVWVSRSMPMGAKMAEDDRKLIRDWVDGGAQE